GNHLGSGSHELNEQAQIISYEEYYSYGSTSSQSLNNLATPKRYRYTAKEREEETGFYYFGSRYYASWLGKWIACDPAGLVDGPNLYEYVRSNPIILNDPTGRQGADKWDESDLARFEAQQGQTLHAYSVFNKENWQVAARVAGEGTAFYVLSRIHPA